MDATVEAIERAESNVRSYSRRLPTVLDRAKGPFLFSESGDRYLDFLMGAGALNYGHNNPAVLGPVIDYLQSGRIVHGLDFHTAAKAEFLEEFRARVLGPRALDYKVQFCGPTGTNAVEAGLKLARKVKGRPGIFSFMGGFHGVSLGSLAVCGEHHFRRAGGVPLPHTTFFPYPEGYLPGIDPVAYMDSVLSDPHSGIEPPAAVIVETTQAEGGVFTASNASLQRLKRLSEKWDFLLICDDTQVGCGRTGPFLSFERTGIVPDLVILSKSVSGFGAPMSLLLIRPELDAWEPNEHNGTFRGNQLAFVGATAALRYRDAVGLESMVRDGAEVLESGLRSALSSVGGDQIALRGIGMIWGLDLSAAGDRDLPARVVSQCYERGLMVETAGRHGSVVKLLPALNVQHEHLEEGCEILCAAIRAALDATTRRHASVPAAEWAQ